MRNIKRLAMLTAFAMIVDTFLLCPSFILCMTIKEWTVRKYIIFTILRLINVGIAMYLFGGISIY